MSLPPSWHEIFPASAAAAATNDPAHKPRSPQQYSPPDQQRRPHHHDANPARSAAPLLSQPGPKLFLAGTLFSALALVTTRRAVARRNLSSLAASLPSTTTQAQLRAQGPAAAALPQTLRTGMPRGVGGASIEAQLEAASTARGMPETVKGPGGTLSSPQPGPPPQPHTTGEPGAAPSEEDPAETLRNSPPLMAVEALGLATLNVLAFAMLAVGSALWALDIRSMPELRRYVRGGLGADGTGRSEEELEQEVEEWVVGVLARKEDKERARERVGTPADVMDGRGRGRGL